MSVIHLLKEEVINQIAAGEVVERPAHLVKELIENSLDAKAHHVHLSVEEGGRQMTLQDDGCGMNEKDLELCIERHSTSKIQKEEDLWKLNSFGFRGEALASIAAVAKLSIVSRPQGSEKASRLNCHFGQKQGPLQRCAGPMGTVLSLKDLFGNTPARLKFLKSPHAEIGQIKKIVKAIALSHPFVEFKVKQGEEVQLFYPKCKTHLQRAKQVLEIENLYEGRMEKKGFTVHAIFASPNESVKSRRQIWLFVQDRWIQDSGLQSAIMGAYTGFVMKGMYPQVALFLNGPKEDVDVNVHPNKSTIRFRDNQLAFKVTYACFRQALEKTPWLSHVLETTTSPSKKTPSYNPYPPLNTPATPLSSSSKIEVHSTPYSSYTQSFQWSTNPKTHFHVKEAVLPYEQITPKEEEEKERQASSQIQSQTPQTQPTPQVQQTPEETKKISSHQPQEENTSWKQLQILGQANLTYIITQTDNSLLFIDQHAAHERVVFESFMLAHQGGKIDKQQLLLPQALPFSRSCTDVLQKQQKNLEKLGIYLENTGPHQMSIVAVPTFIKQRGLVEELKQFCEDFLSLGGSSRIHKIIHDLCASMACHSAIRAGQALTLQEMQTLLDEMDRFPLSSFCPHGRPVFVKYPFRKLERDFGRIP